MNTDSLVHAYRDRSPRIGARVFLAPTAVVIGDVTLGDDVSFWFHTMARGDVHSIKIGARTNVQDGCVLHVTHERHDLRIGAGVVLGHGAIVHGCRIDDGALVGIGARVLDGARIGRDAQIGAGALVPPGMEVPAGTLVLGIPGRVVRDLRPEEIEDNRAIVERYVALKDEYRERFGSARSGPADRGGTGAQRRTSRDREPANQTGERDGSE